MADLNLFQQICVQMFTVDMANMVVGTESHIQKSMDDAVTTAIRNYLGKYNWNVTWGPRVWKCDPSHILGTLDNCWMIMMAPGVLHPDGKRYDTYVVSVAGTSVLSETDWKQEDFGVDYIVDFDTFTRQFKTPPIDPPQKLPKPPGLAPVSAWGTALGAYNIVTNKSPDSHPGAGTTILDYLAGLRKESGNDLRVVFAGHSLGGALSPFLSLAVKANALIPALANNPENILTFATAGATPGDGLLRDAYQRLFPKSVYGGYQGWNADLYNSLDIVPQAWSTNDRNDRYLDNIVGIYGTLNNELHAKVLDMVNGAKARASASGIVYEPIDGNQFTGSAPTSPPGNIITFFLEVFKQHVKAYRDEVGVSTVTAQLYSTFTSADGVKKKTAYEAALGLPVLALGAHHLKNVPEGGLEGVPDNFSYPYDCILSG